MRFLTPRAVVLLPIAKGIIMAVVTLGVGTTFGQGLIITSVSAILTGFFLLVATAMNIRAMRANRGMLHDIKRKLNADNRETDDPAIAKENGLSE